MAEYKPGSFIHMEIASTDPQKTRQFFEQVFDWEFEFVPEMEYSTFVAPSGPGGGLMAPMENQTPGILNYLLSHGIDEDLKRIEQAGGRILQPKREIPGVGHWAVFQDPTGLTLALFETKMPDVRERRRARAATRRSSTRKASKGKKASRGRRGRR